MRIAFYAPLKPLDSPTPSGDRQMGRLIVRALQAGGHEVVQPSRLRLWLKEGGETAQQEKEQVARAEAEQLIVQFEAEGKPDVWLTYHLYHKAPDWLGSKVAAALNIPYIAMEASRAEKRRTGEWAYGFAAADAILRQADAVAACHSKDASGLADVVDPQHLTIVPPFIDAAPFAHNRRQERPLGRARLLTVAMMREGDKMASYKVLGTALAQLSNLDWRLTLVGDGAMREKVLALFPTDRTDWRGEVTPEEIAAIYGEADLFVWPAVREAYGLALMEAQASGVPVVAGATGGVPEIMHAGETGWLAPVGNAPAFAKAVREALSAPQRLAAMGAKARDHILARHDITAAARRLDDLIDLAVRNHGERTKPS